MDDAVRTRVMRRDVELARLVEDLERRELTEVAALLIGWGIARETERRSLATEALERYRELNLLYDLAEHAASLDSAAVMRNATGQVTRVTRRGSAAALIADDAGRHLRPLVHDGGDGDPRARRFTMGQGIVGSAAAGDGEIINDCAADPRATPLEAGMGAVMVAPLRVGGRLLGALLVSAPAGAEFAAGEHRMLSAVAALTAPALHAAMSHERAIQQAQAREAELQRQLEDLRNEVGERRREERVREITGSEYFRTLRQQADALRRTLDADAARSEP